MTFDEFQKLTTEQKLEVSMAHLAGVLRSQAQLTDDEISGLHNASVETAIPERSAALLMRGGQREVRSCVCRFSTQGISIEKYSTIKGFSTIRERGAWSAAQKPRPVKKV